MFYSISFAVGACLLITSLVMFRKSLTFIRQTERAIGKVIEIERVDGSDGATYIPIYRFKTMLNQDVIYRRGYSSSPPGWKIGDEATIAYDPAKPESAKLVTYFGLFGWTIVLMAIAMPLIVIGGGYYAVQSFLK